MLALETLHPALPPLWENHRLKSFCIVSVQHQTLKQRRLLNSLTQGGLWHDSALGYKVSVMAYH